MSSGSAGSRKSPAKYMSFEGGAAAAMQTRKTLRASQRSDTVKYAIAKEAASPLKRTSSMSRSRLYLAAAGNPGAPALNLSPSKMPQENLPGGIGISKNAL